MVAFRGAFGARVRADRRGSAVTEFALIMPILSTFLLGIIEFGTILYSYSAMQFGATAAARQFAVNVSDEAASLAAAKAVLPSWARPGVSLSMTQSDPADINRNVIHVRLTIDAVQATPMSMITRMVPMTLTADASVKQELPYVD
jgi:Flp pilus assembly protein TadG